MFPEIHSFRMFTFCALFLQIKIFSEDCTPEKQQYTQKNPQSAEA